MRTALLLLALPLAGAPRDGNGIAFTDATAKAGLAEPLAGLMGHGGAWGDFDGDGRIDLFVGGFCDRPDAEYKPAPGPVPARLFRNCGDGTFERAAQPAVEFFAGIVYTVSKGARGGAATIYAFDVRAEKAESLGDAAVGTQSYITSIDADPAGRYLYYIPGAHGGAQQDGTPVIQFDVKTRQKKVIAFLASFYKEKYGCTPVGTYSTAIDEKGETLYVTWNVNRGGKAWDCVALAAIHIPAGER